MELAVALKELKVEKLELLIIEWMEQELEIAPEAAPLMLRYLDPHHEGPTFASRDKLIQLSEKPDELVELYELLEQSVAEFLALYLPELAFATKPLIRVNVLQLQWELVCGSTHYDLFVSYLQEQKILQYIEDHRWGYPFETWRIEPDFMEEYQRIWPHIEDPSEDSLPIAQQLTDRLTFTEGVSHELEAYLKESPTFPQDYSEAYKLVATALGHPVVLVMDAEKMLLDRWEGNGRVEVTAILT